MLVGSPLRPPSCLLFSQPNHTMYKNLAAVVLVCMCLFLAGQNFILKKKLSALEVLSAKYYSMQLRVENAWDAAKQKDLTISQLRESLKLKEKMDAAVSKVNTLRLRATSETKE